MTDRLDTTDEVTDPLADTVSLSDNDEGVCVGGSLVTGNDEGPGFCLYSTLALYTILMGSTCISKILLL